jgi:hypothetical protein
MVMPKGVLTNDGSVSMSDFRFSGVSFDESDPDKVENFGFDDVTLGMCRTELVSRVNENPNLEFDPELQDVAITANANGLDMSSIKIASGRKVGSAGYATQKLCRNIPTSAFKQLVLTTLGFNENAMPIMKFRVKYTTRGANRRVIVQLEYDDSLGGGYTAVPDGGMGNDNQGNPFCTSFTSGTDTFSGVIWVSDQASFNDQNAGGTSQRVQNVMITKKAPFLPTYTIIENPTRIGPAELMTAGVSYEDAGSNAVTISNYVGANGYNYKLLIDGSATEYYLKDRVAVDKNPFIFDMMVGDTS